MLTRFRYSTPYVNYNANPKKKKAADCVVRAITTASGLDYYEVYDLLYKASIKTGYVLNEKRCYEKVIEALGFVKMPQPRKSDGTKYDAGEIGSLTDSDEEVIISVANHLTCYVNGNIYDIWDCRHKTIGNYYVRKKNK